MKAVALETGGKSPLSWCLKTAHLEQAVRWTHQGIMADQGSVSVRCVRHGIYDAFGRRFAQYTAKTSVLGDPFQTDSYLSGPPRQPKPKRSSPVVYPGGRGRKCSNPPAMRSRFGASLKRLFCSTNCSQCSPMSTRMLRYSRRRFSAPAQLSQDSREKPRQSKPRTRLARLLVKTVVIE